jgi:hypothetical protein
MRPTWRHARKVLQWCEQEYGWSKYEEYRPTISYRKPDHLTEDVCGWYDDSDCHIHLNNLSCNTIEELVKTVIHEYQHHLQDPKQYQRLAKKLSHEQNPLEIQAEEVALRDYKKCLQELVFI